MAKRLTSGEALLDQVMQAQELQSEKLKDGPLLRYTLEARLDEKRKQFKALTTRFSLQDSIDFSSNDILSLSSSGTLRKHWDIEMASYPGVQIGSGGSRLLDGSHPYTEDLEQRIAQFHGVEGAMILNSGCECNVSIFGTVPGKNDVILYDELVHASIHDGMAISKCRNQLRFKHNDMDSYRERLINISDNFQDVRECKANIFVSVEAIYSMDGDISPLKDLVQIGKEIFPKGNINFIVDEAHATGLLGEHGRGLVSLLGLEKEIDIRVHTFSKALGSYGGVILSNNTVRNYLVNFSRCFMYTAAPAFSTLAAIKVAYDILETDEIIVKQHRLQYLVRHFCAGVRTLPHYQRAKDSGYLTIPVAEDFQKKRFMSHIVPLWSPAADALSIGLLVNKITAYPVAYPTVPKGQKRVRLVFHAGNTESDLNKVLATIGEWLEERFQGENVVTGAEAGIADTWEEFGKIKGLVVKVEMTNGDGVVNGAPLADGNTRMQEVMVE
ncbi:hypothetical protein VE03_04349 [Pseudogymnoascus sp. 23342-1-I1]|nr:hypothetical protein VE03_04349 [Pseudogymnoascus sp. 23342-1-I1]